MQPSLVNSRLTRLYRFVSLQQWPHESSAKGQVTDSDSIHKTSGDDAQVQPFAPASAY